MSADPLGAPARSPGLGPETIVARIVGDDEPALSGLDVSVPWWSFGKLVLAVAALRLAEQGVLALDAAIPGRRFTARQLLRHQSGLPDYGSVPGYAADVAAGRRPWSVSRMLEASRADQLLFEPGCGWRYSNIGFCLLAERIAEAAGTTLAETLDRTVFTPLALRTARLALLPGDLRGVAMGQASAYHPGWVYHGLLVGSVSDAARLLHALLRGGLLKPESLQAMFAGCAVPEHRSALHPNPAYGLGVMLSATDPLAHPIGHAGQGPGSCIAVFGRDDRTAAVWMETPGDPEAASIGFLS